MLLSSPTHCRRTTESVETALFARKEMCLTGGGASLSKPIRIRARMDEMQRCASVEFLRISTLGGRPWTEPGGSHVLNALFCLEFNLGHLGRMDSGCSC